MSKDNDTATGICLHGECNNQNSQKGNLCEHGNLWRIHAEVQNVLSEKINSTEDVEKLVEREKNLIISKEEGSSDEIEGVAGVTVENRSFLRINMGGRDYRALFDLGATLSIMGS